jgi:hypothetical protein
MSSPLGGAPGSCLEPEDDVGETIPALYGFPVVVGGDPAPMFEVVVEAFDDVGFAVPGVKAWASAGAASAVAGGQLISGLREGARRWGGGTACGD